MRAHRPHSTMCGLLRCSRTRSTVNMHGGAVTADQHDYMCNILFFKNKSGTIEAQIIRSDKVVSFRSIVFLAGAARWPLASASTARGHELPARCGALPFGLSPPCHHRPEANLLCVNQSSDWEGVSCPSHGCRI
jgi:hypothetical protein